MVGAPALETLQRTEEHLGKPVYILGRNRMHAFGNKDFYVFVQIIL
jgi:hypothetical protein